MENVSHFFLFKGKLQTKSPSPFQMWPPPVTMPHPTSFMSFCRVLTKTCPYCLLAPTVCAEMRGASFLCT